LDYSGLIGVPNHSSTSIEAQNPLNVTPRTGTNSPRKSTENLTLRQKLHELAKKFKFGVSAQGKQWLSDVVNPSSEDFP
jgi:hypothetical protein